VKGKDFNEVERTELIDDVFERLRPEDRECDEWTRECRGKLVGAPILDITEYGRAVHAEMDALLAAGRSGTSTRGATLYCTTFPCHNCAKHLIAAGLRRVVYVEPYPKSRTGKLYSDSVRFPAGASDESKVLFEPFTGIGPRRFFDLFSVNLGSGFPLKRKEDGGKARSDWTPKLGETKVPLLPTSYIVLESWAAGEIARLFGDSTGD
jgi:deoxycytidylate deaminase